MAYLGICAMPGTDIDKLTKGLSEIPEITECHVVAGRYDIIAKAQCTRQPQHARYYPRAHAPLSIASTETMVSFREAFSRSVPVTNP